MTFINRELRNQLRGYYTVAIQNPHGPKIAHDPLDDNPSYRHALIVDLLDMVEELLDAIGKQRIEQPIKKKEES